METVQAKNGAVHVTSLACATAQEMFDVFQQLDDPARLYASLVDIDFQALAQVADRRNQRRTPESHKSDKRKPGLSCARPSKAGP